MLSDDTDRALDGRKSDLQLYTTMTEMAKTDIRKYREKINSQFDAMEKEILTELDRREARNRQHVDGHISN